MNESTIEKLKTLAEAAKYDVSCAPSGSSRGNAKGGIGTTSGWGICHSFTDTVLKKCVSPLALNFVVRTKKQTKNNGAYNITKVGIYFGNAIIGVRN